MGFFEAIALGVLQGLTEFLPVSSSAHLSLARYFLGLEETPVFFDVMLHVGTLLAVLLFYGPALFRIGRKADASGLADPDGRPGLSVKLILFLILATIPAGAAGVLFRPTKLQPGQSLQSVERGWRQRIGDLREYSSQQPWMVLGFLTATGFVLFVGARLGGGDVGSDEMKWTHVLILGCAQAVSAICPGMSRAGMTVSTGMAIGLRPHWAVHFSLLMSLPAILGAAVLKARDVDPQWLTRENLSATAVGTLVSAVVGWCCIQLLLKAVRAGRWWWFSIYIWTFAAVVALVLLGSEK